MSLTKKILLGMGLGIVVGLILNLALPGMYDTVQSYILYPLGKIFVNLIKMLVVPIVVVSLILGTAGISDPKKLGRIGVKTISFFLITTAIAIILAIGMSYLFHPGSGDFQLDGADYEATEAPPVIDTLVNIIPTNPVNAMAQESMLQIIVFSIFIGYGLSRLGEKVNGIYRLIEQANDVLMFLVNVIMKFAPFGAFALIATAIGGQGFDAIMAMGKYMFVVLFVLLLQLVLVYGSALSFLGKMNPIKFFKGFSPAMIVAFSTSSSSATLPISMKSAQNNLNVSKSVSGFVQPLGATINMDGTAIMQGVATVFIAQVYGSNLSLSQLLTILLTATLASIGTAGVPGVGLIMLSMVLTSVGLPVEAIALVLGVDRLLDMCRTSVNITGDAVCAVIVDRSEGKQEDLVSEEKSA
ncbi:dicarboxylate/amino acid:cation symporter [Cytobacillus solani]|uniref:Sodium:dicarboxylate symporter n=1 Tax=Cytobacillus solani TaxID=1637975 RepID=A0A0Q3QPW8_9BACI|nr:dicarboxylate/amino acid:cation symporter [Cytobacillus solani]KOP82636.1 sodium:dicarboxylate symporter [Bacillus sp. FJAT-21945]KQL19648.1 sodium:dicarboxylate symporter [Cytobacillus solani]USK52879.1 dicarboxylate/amino acid:cation symporter [Cytobacillus solani]